MKPNILTTWVIAPLLFVIFFVVFILIAVFDVQRDAEKTAEQMMQQTGEYLQSTMMVLQKLNTIADAPCSDSFIERLRVEVFKSDSVRDIAYVDGNRVLCSAGSGFLKSDGLLDKEDLQGAMERKFWFNMQLMQAGVRVSVTAQQLGNYVIVEYPGHFQSTIASSAYDSAVVAVFPDSSYYFAYGNKDITRILQRPFVLGGGVACSDEPRTYCVAVEMHDAEMLASALPLLTLGLVLSFLLALLGKSLADQMLSKRYSLQGRVRRALEKEPQNFYCVFQPIVELSTSKTMGCEVLARFQDDIGGLSPIDFIPVVQQMRQTWKFTELIMARAVEELNRCDFQGRAFYASFNVFPEDLSKDRAEIISTSKPLAAALNSPFDVVIEILETSIDYGSGMHESLEFLRKMGVRIAIDDFGTGHSNLNMLINFEADLLKIDRSFVDGSEDPESVRAKILPIMVEIADTAGLKKVAEGIETQEQADHVLKVGVELGQGYFFSRPVSAEVLTNYVQNH
ncbi:hypothetical protein C4K68_01805 [Pokkaliibacter plantistimulans]|uniref:cyclic-guanylate-specific phosphodiesterase n=1 Tax=Proteobacteria bacterium 228 TaxID=2083153 RepID=A0A2S5KWN3_9PROT|nr:EAL domain-containing protein [Pokkaliibacter plantistimulans]PPC79180.1 hypothetical protein C4K68_01805 [Pokkaliibacter plantistimulans]